MLLYDYSLDIIVGHKKKTADLKIYAHTSQRGCNGTFNRWIFAIMLILLWPFWVYEATMMQINEQDLVLKLF